MESQKTKKMMKKLASSKHLPIEIETQIVKKILDLKTLCVCKGVSKGFRDIVTEVDTVVYTCEGDNFESAMASLLKFTWLKSLHIVLPFDHNPNPAYLYRWKMTFGSRNDSFVFLSQNETDPQEDNDGVDEEEVEDDQRSSVNCTVGALDCLDFAVDSFKMVWGRINGDYLPLLQLVSIRDSANRGRVTVGEDKISQLRKLKCKVSARIRRVRGHYWFLGSLKLPVSGCVMKEVRMIVKGVADGVLKRDYGEEEEANIVVEDEEEKIYNEAIKETLQRGEFTDLDEDI